MSLHETYPSIWSRILLEAAKKGKGSIAVTEDEFFQNAGFKDGKEAHHMIASVDLTDRKTWNYFEVWKRVDGTKEGLEKVLALKEQK